MSTTGGSSSSGSLRYQQLRQREGLLGRAAIVVFMVVGAAIFYVWSHSQIINMGMKLSDMQKKQVKLMEENQRLMLERSSLRNLGRIETYASDKLGMIYPGPSRIRAVRKP